MDERRRRKEAIDGGDWIRNIQTARLLGHLSINRQDAVCEGIREIGEPVVQSQCGWHVPTSHRLDSPAKLAYDENACEQERFVSLCEPRSHALVGSLRLP